MKLSKQRQMYESEFTQFLNELKQKSPSVEQGQCDGLALLWDKGPIDLDQQRRVNESRVKQQPYVYQSKL